MVEAERRIAEAERIGATELDLQYLNLEIVPEAVGRLTGLTHLSLGNNRLTGVPESVGQLTKLTELQLFGNQLTVLPESVGRLTKLTHLDLGGNQLTGVPESVGQLTGLTHLDLDHNRLTVLPELVSRLTGLTRLNLFGNRLTVVPESVGRLTGLTRLYLADNMLTGLPRGLLQLVHLTHLFLHNNPSLGLPPEVLGPTHSDVFGTRQDKPADPAAILRFYFTGRANPAVAAARRPLAEAKVLVVGEADVGKSTLVARLVYNQPRDPNRKKTEKIDVTPWPVQLPRPNGGGPCDVKLNVWDFGGQEIMHATHQFFLTKRSLYVLVASARDSEEQNRLAYWLKMVQSYGGDAPVLLVINKIDDGNLTLNETGWLDDYGRNLRGIHRVSCETGTGIDALRADILDHVARLPHVFDELPETYFDVKARLEERAEKENFLDYSTYEKICSAKKLTDKADQKLLIRFLHDLGVVLHFDDPDNPFRLEMTTVLSRDWVTRGVYAIINDNALSQDHGRLSRAHLERILPEAEYPGDKRQFIVGMMQRFELCFEYETDKGCWLVPELLQKNAPRLDWREGESLNFRYGYDVLPAGFISRFIVRTHGYLRPDLPRWRSGVQLDIDGHTVLVRGDTDKGMVFITVQGPPAGRQRALAVVRHEFGRIHATVPGLSPKQLVPLPDRPDLFADYETLRTYERLELEWIVPDGADKKYSVQDLLNGVSTREERDREPDKPDPVPPKPEPVDPIDTATSKVKKIGLLLAAVGAVIAVVLTAVGDWIAAVKKWFTG